MLRFLVIRSLRIAITLWAVVTFVFIVLRLAGDPVTALVPADASDAVLALYRERLGLDRPLAVQYLNYLRNVVSGEFGYSFRTAGPALDLVLARLPATLLLGGLSLILSLAAGLSLGILAALHRNRAADRLVMSLAVFGFAMPNFFFAILLILLFTLTLQWLPSAGIGDWRHLIMPVLTLGLASAGTFARFTRSSLLEVLGKPYMQTAAAKGVPFWRRLFGHALPNAAIPLVTILGFSVGALIGGAVVTETVFAWPGIGRLLVVSVSERDLAVVQLLVLLIALAMSLANLAVDLLYGLIDPRIRISEAVR